MRRGLERGQKQWTIHEHDAFLVGIRAVTRVPHF